MRTLSNMWSKGVQQPIEAGTCSKSRSSPYPHVLTLRTRPKCSANDGRLPTDSSVHKLSKQDMQAKLEKARQYKQAKKAPASQPAPNVPAVVRPNVSATERSSDSSALETDLLITNTLRPDAGVQGEHAAFVIGEQTDDSAVMAAGVCFQSLASLPVGKHVWFL